MLQLPNRPNTSQIVFPFYARLALVLISLLLICVFMIWAKGIMIPLTFGLLVAILIYPLCRFLENKTHLSRSIATTLSLLIFIASVGIFMYFFSIQIVHFYNDFPDLKPRFEHTINDLQNWINVKFHFNRIQQSNYINKSVAAVFESVAQSLGDLLVALSSLLIYIIFVLIFAYFMLFYRSMLVQFTILLFKPKHKETVIDVLKHTKSMMSSYISGLLIEMVILSVVNSAALIALGIPYAVLLGVMSAVLNIIPYLGIYTSIVITMFVTFANGTLPLTLEAGTILLAIHFIDANILMPKIIGARVKMNPFITILAVVLGEFIWGVPGMFLFIPLVGLVKLICERVPELEAWAVLIGVSHTSKPKKMKEVTNP